jgi:assimilatory nitrate reductase catalytic subunit
MIVCICKGVSDRAVMAAMDSGACGAAAIAAATGAGTECGGCREELETLAGTRGPCSSPPCPGCRHASQPRAQERT